MLSTVFWQSWTYICTDALSSLWDLGEGIVDGGDVGDDRLLIWRRNINVCGGKVKNGLFGSAVRFSCEVDKSKPAFALQRTQQNDLIFMSN